MSEYDDVVESTLVEEEQALEEIESAGSNTQRRHRAKYLSVYITVISLVVAVAALGTAFAADEWMADALEQVAGNVDFFTLRVEKRCHEIRRDLASLGGTPLDQQFQDEMAHTEAALAAVTRARARVEKDAAVADRAHYVLAVAITCLQMATALAAVMSAVNAQRLMYASIVFACSGIVLTIFGMAKFLT